MRRGPGRKRIDNKIELAFIILGIVVVILFAVGAVFFNH